MNRLDKYGFNDPLKEIGIDNVLNTGCPTFWNLDKAHNILCKNEEYRLLNSNMGGIFSSSNQASSLWKKIY